MLLYQNFVDKKYWDYGMYLVLDETEHVTLKRLMEAKLEFGRVWEAHHRANPGGENHPINLDYGHNLSELRSLERDFVVYDQNVDKPVYLNGAMLHILIRGDIMTSGLGFWANYTPEVQQFKQKLLTAFKETVTAVPQE